MKRISLLPLLFLFALSSRADLVHVFQQTVAGTTTNRLSDTVFATGRSYLTQAAPAKSGYLFTHWSISTQQAFSPRDAWGRAYDAVPFTLYEETTLTAHYLPVSQDTDADGVTDGYEFYWYGSLAESAPSDSDGDGATFAEELAAGTNPLFPERHAPGPVRYADGALWLYNPFGYAPLTVRSEPEGALFATRTEYLRPGTAVASGTAPGAFAYWTLGGVRQADAWGRALDSLTLTMPSNALELVAVAESDYMDRMALYWYGSLAESVPSDSDGDGATFAEELAAGTNPLFPERHAPGPVRYADGALLQYNPYNLQPYVLRSEPEGALFETTSGYVRAGTRVTSGAYSPASTVFAYWTLNGAEQRDAWGRALDTVSLPMPTNAVELVAHTEEDAADRQALYWYGSPDVSAQSDTDGDGRTFAEELAAGTNPLFPERHEPGPVRYADSSLQEMNLQPYEQAAGAVVDGAFEPMFASSVSGAPGTVFGDGSPVTPVVWDLNGDGLFDLVVLWKCGFRTYLNVGSPGNPEFEERKDVSTNGVDLAMNDTAKLGVLSFDVPPLDALSATTNGAVLLVSDADGRIWYYQGTPGAEGPSAPESLSFVLQHKVWGGSHPGFAEGMRLAAVDWEDDGDLDCLCGTSDGRLLLLRDPKVGRPTNVRAEAGVDTVVLTWDPNRQSRIRGYRLYRAEADAEAAEARIAEPQLPTYRDTPPAIASYDYRVSSVSRFYTAGNSTPTVSESPKTEAVRATPGGVRFFWNDANAKLGDRVEVAVSIENALRYDVAGRTEIVSYDPAFLRPIEVRTSGLTEGIEFQEAASGGAWNVTMTRGVLPAGSGRFLTFVFDTLQAGETAVGGATVTIAPAGTARYFLGDVDGDGDLTVLDIRLLAKLKNGELGRRASAEQVQAGDFNGNGKLDNADYQALRERLKQLGIL